jgi:hypothetical protein
MALDAAQSETNNLLEKKSRLSGMISAIVGGSLHALVEQPLTNPIEAAITQTQVNGRSFIWNFSDLFHKRALYRSLPVSLAGAVPKAVIHYSILNYFTFVLAPGADLNQSSSGQAAFIGSLVGATEVLLTNPINFVKFRMQRPEWGYSGSIDAVKTIFKVEGLQAFWKGTSWTFCRNTICNGTMVGGFKAFDTLLEGIEPEMISPNYRHFLAGSLSGVAGSLFSYPFEMMRAAKQHNLSFYEEIYSKGPKRLLAGWLPGAGRLMFSSAIMGSIIPHLKDIQDKILS